MDEEVVVTPEVTEEAPVVEEEVVAEPEVDWKSEAQKAKEIADNYKIRAEKAEKAAKAVKEAPAHNPSGLSSADLLAVSNAKIHEDDIERVERFAKSEGLSIKEALKNPEMKAVLDLRAEQRNVAEATNIGNVRRGNVQVDDSTLIANASQGKLPENDYEIERLIAAKAKENKG